jgi:hypothetical protein
MQNKRLFFIIILHHKYDIIELKNFILIEKCKMHVPMYEVFKFLFWFKNVFTIT